MSLQTALLLAGAITSAGQLLTEPINKRRNKKLSKRQNTLQLAKDSIDNEVFNLQSAISPGMSRVRQVRNADIANQISSKQKQSNALGHQINELELKKGY